MTSLDSRFEPVRIPADKPTPVPDVGGAASFAAADPQAILQVLSAIRTRQVSDLPAGFLGTLATAKLVLIMSDSDYQAAARQVEALQPTCDALYKAEQAIRLNSQAYAALSRKLDSFLHRLLTSGSALERESIALQARRSEVERATKQRAECQATISNLRILQDQLREFIPTSEGYVQLTYAGWQLESQLRRQRSAALGGTPARTPEEGILLPTRGRLTAWQRLRPTSASLDSSLWPGLAGDAIDDGCVNLSTGFFLGGLLASDD